MRSTFPRRRLALLLALPLVAGCHSWRPATLAPQALIMDQQPREVRFTLANGSLVEVTDPLVLSDSILGVTDLGPFRAPAGDVVEVEVREFSPTKSFALTLAHVSAIFSIIAIVIHVQPHYRGL